MVRDTGMAGGPQRSSAERQDGFRWEARSSFSQMRFDGSSLHCCAGAGGSGPPQGWLVGGGEKEIDVPHC